MILNLNKLTNKHEAPEESNSIPTTQIENEPTGTVSIDGGLAVSNPMSNDLKPKIQKVSTLER